MTDLVSRPKLFGVLFWKCSSFDRPSSFCQWMLKYSDPKGRKSSPYSAFLGKSGSEPNTFSWAKQEDSITRGQRYFCTEDVFLPQKRTHWESFWTICLRLKSSLLQNATLPFPIWLINGTNRLLLGDAVVLCSLWKMFSRRPSGNLELQAVPNPVYIILLYFIPSCL